MKLTEQQKNILLGKICPYCGQDSKLVDSIEVYGTHYGDLWMCKPCDAYVSCHEGTEVAMGRLANKYLREWKKKTHEAFDTIWKKKIMTRTEAYMWLSEELGIPPEYMHIGMLGVDNCKLIILKSMQVLEKEGIDTLKL